MKYICKIEINLPIDSAIKLWENENNYKEWQDDFQSIEHLSEIPNSKGAKARIIFQGKRRIELIETILVSDVPNEKTALYEHIHMTNTQTTRFRELEPNKTQYITEVEYIKFNGLLIKLIAFLFPSKFKGQSEKWMLQFKQFAEKAAN